jgi:hypothetical protein
MSYVREPRHTNEEYQKYSQKKYRLQHVVAKIALYLILAFIVVIAALIYTGFDDSPPVTKGLALLAGGIFAISIIVVFVGQMMSATLDVSVDKAIAKERDALHERVTTMSSDLQNLAARISDIKFKGYTVMAGAGSTGIIGSDISDSFNTIKIADPALADALQTITGAVERSENKEAGQAWERFMKQAVGEKDKTILSALWYRVVKLVPDIASLAESVAKIATLFT